MEFGSEFVYNYSDSSEEEEVSEEEYDNLYTSCVPERFQARSPESRQAPPPPPVPHASTSGAAEVVLAEAAGCSRSDPAKSAPPADPAPPKPGRHWIRKSRSSKSQAADSVPPVEVKRMAPMLPSPKMLPPRSKVSAAKRWRRADTNVVAIKFDQLTAPRNMHTGDMVICTGCQVMLSHISKLTKDDNGDVWTCEFCGVANRIVLAPEEIPTQPDVTYMVEPAPTLTASGRIGKDESLVVFCIDTSGSMCVSTEVPGVVRLKGNHSERYRNLAPRGESQWLDGQRRNVTYVTRLQGVQAAVEDQIRKLSKDHPDRHVALITFANEVTVVGDGSGIPVTIAGDKLNNEEELMSIGQNVVLPSSVSTSHDTLEKKIFNLEEGGQTALGPALLVSVMLACRVPGSKVIICTDGMANMGLGNLHTVTPEQFESASQFYQKVSDLANSKGVSVSILTIAGTECRLVELGRVASQTGGQVNAVDPLKLTMEFGNILADPIIATQVVATFLVHKGLYIRSEGDKTSRAIKEVGNVTRGMEITFEYGVRGRGQKRSSSEEAAKTELAEPAAGDGAAAGGLSEKSTTKDVPPAQEMEFPFQVQIQYVDQEGSKAMRVLTQMKPITKERRQAETHMNMPILSAHALQQSSSMALEGNYTSSRLNAFMYQRLFHRNVSDTAQLNYYKNYNMSQAPVCNGILFEQRKEASSRGRTVYELDDESVDYINTLQPQPVQLARRMQCPDTVAHNLYANAQASSSRAAEEEEKEKDESKTKDESAEVQNTEEK